MYGPITPWNHVVIMMALGPLPKDQEERRSNVKGVVRRKSSRWVTWIAITMGVFMVGIGILLSLWGFAWQANVGELGPDDSRVGGPYIIPIGLVFIGLGGLWVWNGYHGFPRRGDMEDMKVCPKCHRKIEADLDFCYHCNAELSDDGEKKPGKDNTEPEKKRRKAADLDQL